MNHSPNHVRRQHGGISKSSVFWLALLAVANVLVSVLMGTEPAAPIEPPPLRASIEPSLMLLGELSPEQREAMTRKITPPAERLAPLVPKLREVCRIWGPFSELSAVEPIEAVVEGAGRVIEIQSTQISSAPDFLVYLETDNNIDNARRFMGELQAQNLDAYVISGGAYRNSVSVGVFSSEQRAIQQRKRLADLGYEPRIQALEREQTVYHLVGRVPEDFRLETHGHTDCPAIASAR